MCSRIASHGFPAQVRSRSVTSAKHFPDTDPRYKGRRTASTLLRHVTALVRESGWQPRQSGCDHYSHRRASSRRIILRDARDLAAAIGCAVEQVSGQGDHRGGLLGFTGSKQGIAAHCNACSSESEQSAHIQHYDNRGITA